MRYSENLPFDAEVDIDYTKKKVKFNYPIEARGKKEQKRAISIVVTPVIGLLALIIILTILAIGIKTSDETWKVGLVIYLVLTLYYIPKKLVVELIYRNYKYFRDIIPKVNAFIYKLFMKKRLLINQTTNKKVEIPFFHNIVLEYQAKGDFAKYLKQIKIREYKFRRIEGRRIEQYFIWKCIFYFKKDIKEGALLVEYV